MNMEELEAIVKPVLNDSGEDAPELRIALLLTRNLLHSLAFDGMLDLERLDDIAYLQDVILSNAERANEFRVSVTIHKGFVTTARELFISGKCQESIVILATAVEQCLNSFYNEALSIKGGLSDVEIIEVIRSNNIAPKIGWLLALVANYELDQDFRNNITELMEVRNQIVHYKAAPSKHFDDHETNSYDRIRQHIDQLNSKGCFDIPDQLEGLLEEAIADLNDASYDNHSKVEEAFKRLYESQESEERKT